MGEGNKYSFLQPSTNKSILHKPDDPSKEAGPRPRSGNCPCNHQGFFFFFQICFRCLLKVGMC